MSRQAGGDFARDRESVRSALLSAGSDAQDAVIVLTHRPEVLVSFSDDRTQAARRVGALTPSFARGSYLEALRLAQAMLSQSLGEKRQILFYGDLQENQWTENETSPPFLSGVEVVLPHKPETPWRANLSLGTPEARRFFVGEDSYVDLTLELRYQGPFRSTRVAVTSNGRPVLSRDLPLEGDSGLVTLRGQWRSAPGEWIEGEAAIDGAKDSLPADDHVYFVLPPVEEGRVALLGRSPYLRAALSPATMKGRWITQILDPSAGDLAALPEADLPEILLLESDYAQSQQVRTLVGRCLSSGRGVLLFVRRLTPLVRGFLAELGFSATERPGGEEDTFRLLAAEHPIFKPFLNGE
ncbi:MAG TPA: VWA domain-containing protein, partial [Vicinamibacteria bacterium]|nr:VWA domain-containing protein [Vicinamibacteria bacterium]